MTAECGIEFGLGHFGDLRLQKGGPCCIRRWWNGPVLMSAGWLAIGRGRCSSSAFWTTMR